MIPDAVQFVCPQAKTIQLGARCFPCFWCERIVIIQWFAPEQPPW